MFDFTGFASLFRNISFENSMVVSVALVFIIAAAIAFVAKMLKQDLILAYIVAGILIGPLYFGLVKDANLVKGLAEIGITFLLFTAGLEMNLKNLKKTLSTSLITGIVQVVSVTALTIAILIAFKFNAVEAAIIGVAIALSSTIVVTKLLIDRHEINALHSRLILSIMLVQDIIAVFVLAMLSQTFSTSILWLVPMKLAMLVAVALIMHFFLLKPLMRHSASSSELLFVMSIATLFFFSGLAYFLNFSIAIGAFIAGITLANNPYKLEISTRTKALRDFFSVIFFVTIGMLLTSITKSTFLLLLPILAILIIFEPLITSLIIRLRGYKTGTSLQVGFSFAQVSEFSLILVIAALSGGLISQRAFDVTVLATVISMALTQYTSRLNEPIAKYLPGIFSFIRNPAHHEEEKKVFRGKEIVLLGSHLMGTVFLKELKKNKQKLLVVDFNPDITKALVKQNIDCIYGDASNP
ncbi:MAG: cation:proton antiporter, partial [Candidatus Paceibacterota bacterium]